MDSVNKDGFLFGGILGPISISFIFWSAFFACLFVCLDWVKALNQDNCKWNGSFSFTIWWNILSNGFPPWLFLNKSLICNAFVGVMPSVED